jgi:DnaJ-class molecular chaperone
MICPTCHGNGHLKRPKAVAFNNFFRLTKFRLKQTYNCPRCSAQGELYEPK